MRTKSQFIAAYTGISVAEFASRTSQSVGNVRKLIAAGWFDGRKAPDGMPELIDIAAIGSRQPRYKIHPAAVDRFLEERAARAVRKAS